MSLSSNALCAKAKAMYGGRLNKNVYLDLTRKQTIGEVVKISNKLCRCFKRY